MIHDLDPQSSIPLYLQIAEQVRRHLSLGARKPGDRFLTVRERGLRACVNRNTATRAVAELEPGRPVRTGVGQGTFIADAAASTATTERDAALGGEVETLLAEAHTLGVPPDELGWRNQRTLEQFSRAPRDREKERS